MPERLTARQHLEEALEVATKEEADAVCFVVYAALSLGMTADEMATRLVREPMDEATWRNQAYREAAETMRREGWHRPGVLRCLRALGGVSR